MISDLAEAIQISAGGRYALRPFFALASAELYEMTGRR
jgi:hypothetical protein